MITKNNEETLQIAKVAATLAIENMYVSEEFLNNMVKVTKGEKTYEELRQEVIKKHAR